jgi:hypothetical protein
VTSAGTTSDQFTRREVNRALLAATLMLAAPTAVVTRRPGMHLFDFAIAGGGYHGLYDVREELMIGEELKLRAEPDNPFDVNAVAVHRAGGLMLGYLPREANAPVARLLASGESIEARVIGRLVFGRAEDVPDDFAFTGFVNGDPRIRLLLRG